MPGLSTLRARLAALMDGSAGTTKTMPAGRFVAVARDVTLEDAPVDAIDRRFDITLERGVPLTPYNGYDADVRTEHRVLVRVGYLYTAAGGDWPERADGAGGSGELDAIEDRITADDHDITMVLCWGENFAGLSPDVFDVYRDAADAYEILEPDAQRRILVVPLRARVEWDYQTPGAYVP